MSVPGAFEEAETSTSPSLPFYRTEARNVVEHAGTLRLQDEGAVEPEESRYALYPC